jgi:hypothetical protein
MAGFFVNVEVVALAAACTRREKYSAADSA